MKEIRLLRTILFTCSILFFLITPLVLVNPVYSDFYIYAYGGFYQKDITIYWAKTDDVLTMEWDASAGTAYYECRLDWVQGDKILQTYSLGTTTDTQINITAPRAGVFIAGIRACDINDSCSIWVFSTDPVYAVVDGEHKAWIIIFSLAGPGPFIP
jgi:hypothetical protein